MKKYQLPESWFPPSPPAPGRVVGPALSAVRGVCKSQRKYLVGLVPVFDRIGRHLDATLSHPSTDKLLPANVRRLVIAVSDAAWRDKVLITDYRVDEVAPLMASAGSFLASYADARGDQFSTETLSDGLSGCWAKWSRHAGKSFRRGAPAWNDLADVSVGSLLLISPDLRRRLDRIAVSGAIPVLAIAINSSGTTREHLKCSVRAIVFPLPAWMRASGIVAGHA